MVRREKDFLLQKKPVPIPDRKENINTKEKSRSGSNCITLHNYITFPIDFLKILDFNCDFTLLYSRIVN